MIENNKQNMSELDGTLLTAGPASSRPSSTTRWWRLLAGGLECRSRVPAHIVGAAAFCRIVLFKAPAFGVERRADSALAASLAALARIVLGAFSGFPGVRSLSGLEGWQLEPFISSIFGRKLRNWSIGGAVRGDAGL